MAAICLGLNVLMDAYHESLPLSLNSCGYAAYGSVKEFYNIFSEIVKNFTCSIQQF